MHSSRLLAILLLASFTNVFARPASPQQAAPPAATNAAPSNAPPAQDFNTVRSNRQNSALKTAPAQDFNTVRSNRQNSN